MAVTSDSVITLQWESREPFGNWTPGKSVFSSTRKMVSSNHYPLNTRIDDGGLWILEKVLDIPTAGYLVNGNRFRGQFTTQGPSGFSFMTAPTQLTDSQMTAEGTTAIARSAPTNPSFSLATFLGELAGDGLPNVVGRSLVKERVKRARSAGSEYLNVEFGWKPLVSDLQSFAKTVKDSHRLLEEYRKGSDKKMRVGYSFPSADSTKTFSGGGFLPSPSSVDLFGQGTISETVHSKSWFAGAFRYHIPTSDTQLGKFRQWASYADHLLGVKPTPEVVWNIAPWSWAVDWFTNTGDVMTNISNLGRDGLVLQYGYIMSHREYDRQIVARFNNVPTSRRIQKIYKKRLPATPYGFGVNLSTLSAKQIAVVSALGLSRT